MRSIVAACMTALAVAACGSAKPGPGAGAADLAPAKSADLSPAVDTGGDALVADAAPPSCGDASARFTLLTGADAGLVRDNVTHLVWMRDAHGAGEPPQTQSLAISYCTGRGMRLPTKDEAVELANHYAACAFSPWSTWTSTAAGMGYAWVVDYTGGTSTQLVDNFPSAVLCVK